MHGVAGGYARGCAVSVPEVVSACQQMCSWMVLNTELLGRSERRSMLDVDVGGAEFSRRDVLRRNLKGLGVNLLCVAPRFNGLVVPDFGCQKQLLEAELEMRLEESSSQ